jgi:outer membrane protein
MRLLIAAALLCGAPGAASAEGLEDALALAYQTNPTLNGARAQARAAREERVQAGAAYLPNVAVVGTYTTRESRGEQPIFDALRNEVEQPSSVGVEVNQPLYTGGRRGAQSRAARAIADGAEEQLRATEQSVMLGAIAAYMDVRRDERIVGAQTENVEGLAAQLQAARDRLAVGEVTRTDVVQAEARLAAGQAELASGKAELDRSRANYELIVGLAPGSLEDPPPPPALPNSLEEAVTGARQFNPSLARAREERKRVKAQTAVERSARKPELTLSGRVSREEDGKISTFENDTASATARLTVPLFSGGLNNSRVRQSKQNEAAAEAQLEEVERRVVADVTSAWSQMYAANLSLDAARRREEASRVALDGVIQEQMIGLRTTLDILNAQGEVLAGAVALARAERDAYVAAHNVLVVMGALDPETLGVETERRR